MMVGRPGNEASNNYTSPILTLRWTIRKYHTAIDLKLYNMAQQTSGVAKVGHTGTYHVCHKIALVASAFCTEVIKPSVPVLCPGIDCVLVMAACATNSCLAS